MFTVHMLDDGCLVKARAYRSQKKNEAPHTVEIVLKKGPQYERDASKCSCAIGSSGLCGHITGLLYTLAHMKTSNMKTIPTDIAKTSLPQTWHIPRGEKIGGASSDNTSVVGYDSRNSQRQTRGIHSTLYNPIPSNYGELPLTELCNNLEAIDKSCLLLSVVNPEDQTRDTATKFGNFPRGSPLGVQQKANSEYILNILDCEDFPNLPAQNFMTNNLAVLLDHSKSVKFDSLSVTEEQATEIEKMTRLQAQEPRWHKIRQDRITASIAGDIVRRRKDYEPLVDRLRTSRKVITSSMRHGIASEPLAANAYVEALNGDVNIHPCGLVVSPWAPWLAATPDRKVYFPSLQPPYGLLEIKCPVNQLSDCAYLTKDENGYHLKQTHKYFHQVMMQMAVTGLEWCHFFVWTPEESHLELIKFDTDSWMEMKDKLDVFFFYHYLI